jgi:hypothetical protein
VLPDDAWDDVEKLSAVLREKVAEPEEEDA